MYNIFTFRWAYQIVVGQTDRDDETTVAKYTVQKIINVRLFIVKLHVIPNIV